MSFLFSSLCFRYFNSVAFYSVALIAFVFSLVSYKVVFVPFKVTFLFIHSFVFAIYHGLRCSFRCTLASVH